MGPKSQRIKNAVLDLLRMSLQRGCKVAFVPPDDPQEEYGNFTPGSMRIKIMKERTAQPTAWHVYSFAHEYRHLCQFLALDGPDTWLYSLDYTHKNNLLEDARLELDADKFAADFAHERGIPFSKELVKFIEDRKSHYDEIIEKNGGKA